MIAAKLPESMVNYGGVESMSSLSVILVAALYESTRTLNFWGPTSKSANQKPYGRGMKQANASSREEHAPCRVAEGRVLAAQRRPPLSRRKPEQH